MREVFAGLLLTRNREKNIFGGSLPRESFRKVLFFSLASVRGIQQVLRSLQIKL